LPSVVDDIDFAVTHVVRGEDHVTNTGTQIQIFRALDAEVPRFAQLPLLTDESGGGLSKRLGALAVADYVPRVLNLWRSAVCLRVSGRQSRSSP